MVDSMDCDICVIGAGSAGLSVAAGAAQLGAATVLIERGRMGGDCLNYGCVPSKSLLAAAKAVSAGEQASRLGVRYAPPEVDFSAVHDHVQGVIAAIAPMDSVERFEGLGVTVLQGSARFTGPREVAVGDRRIRARRIVVATGSRPFVPPIQGLAETPYLTNETVFELEQCPQRLIVIGGGPIGCELGQAFRLLGAEVCLVEMATILPKDDPELVEVIRRRLLDDGVELHEGSAVVSVERREGGVAVVVERDGQRQTLLGSHLLVAAGRVPNIEDLDLAVAGIEHERGGIATDRRLRSSNRKVFAAGDVAGGPQFTHIAGYHAGIIIRNALFRLPAKLDMTAVPWVTYCQPELAHVGMTEAMAREAGNEVRLLRWPFFENDRAQAERATEGLIKAVVTPKGRILGASIVGSGAGELVFPWGLAIAKRLKVSALAGAIAPYPTRREISKRVAGSFFAPKLFSDRTRRLVRLLARLG
jgi:pyruvate/2-oxoglutarate dehydrogenase complex dihydrolipoamide dehydrogenase (E3) component